MYLYFLGMSPMSAMSAAGLAATSAATNSYPVLFVYFFYCISCVCVFYVHLLCLSFSCIWKSFPGLFLTPRLRYAQLSHRGHDLVRLRPQVLFKVFLLLDKLKYNSVFHDTYIECFLSGKTPACDHVTTFRCTNLSFQETCREISTKNPNWARWKML